MHFSFIGKSLVLYSSPAHIHDTWEVVLNLEGEGQAVVGDTSVGIKAGTVICIPPNTPHSKQAERGFQDIFIHFPSFPVSQNDSPIVFEDEDGRVGQLMSMIYNIYHKKENNYKAITQQLSYALEQIIITRLNTKSMDPRVSHIADLAVENFTNPDFNLHNEILESGYCEDHLRRLFKKEFGCSPLEYITKLRVNYAKKLLRENKHLHYNVAQIGVMVGFSDIGYFSRVFKKQAGVSPREYMKKYS